MCVFATLHGRCSLCGEGLHPASAATAMDTRAIASQASDARQVEGRPPCSWRRARSSRVEPLRRVREQAQRGGQPERRRGRRRGSEKQRDRERQRKRDTLML